MPTHRSHSQRRRTFNAPCGARHGLLSGRPTPGRDFGEAGEGWLRFCYAASEDKLQEALARLGPVLGELGG